MANILFIGSTAFKIHGGERSATKDIDFIATYEDGLKYLKSRGVKEIFPSGGGSKLIGVTTQDDGSKFFYEHEIAWSGTTSEKLLNYETAGHASSMPSFPIVSMLDGSYTGLIGQMASLEALYALKMSHRYKKNSPHFSKTMGDIHAMRDLGATVPDSLQGWLKERERETYDYGHPKLNQSKSNFFADDGIDYRYDHDSLHLAVKEMSRPAYDYFKPDTSEVFCSKEMFDACSEDIKLNAVYEETAVLALERSIIPHAGVLTPEQAFTKSLEKVCTSITSGWFREYAWEHYFQALSQYERLNGAGRNYVSLFEQGLKNGIVKPFV